MSELRGWSKADIADTLYLSIATVCRIRACFRLYGEVSPPSNGRRYRTGRAFSDDDLNCLRSMLERDPLLVVHEMRDLLISFHRRSYPLSTICDATWRLGFSRKIITKISREARRLGQTDFCLSLNRLMSHPDQLVFMVRLPPCFFRNTRFKSMSRHLKGTPIE